MPGEGGIAPGRAIEHMVAEAHRMAARAELLAEKIDERMTRHEEQCSEDRRDADKKRETLRAEMNAGFDALQASNSRIHGRINALIIGVGAYIIATLVIVAGALFWKLQGW